MLEQQDKAKLALESMDVLFKLYLSNSGGLALNSKVKAIMENWEAHTCKPFNEENFYKAVEASIAHLKKKQYEFIPGDIIP